MTPDSPPFVNQLRLEFSFWVSSSPLPWVLAQPHLRASPNTIAAPLLLLSSNFCTFILLHGSFINSAWLLLGFLTLEDGLTIWYQSQVDQAWRQEISSSSLWFFFQFSCCSLLPLIVLLFFFFSPHWLYGSYHCSFGTIRPLCLRTQPWWIYVPFTFSFESYSFSISSIWVILILSSICFV